MRPLLRTLITLSLIAAVFIGFTPQASAAPNFQVAWTGTGLPRHAAPSLSSPQVDSVLPDGTTVTVVCETTGEPVSNGQATSAIWERLIGGSYIPNAWLNTGVDGWTPGVPRCDQVDAPLPKYNRDAAANWATDHVDSPPAYSEDCTWFSSNVLWAGGIPMTDDWHATTENSSDTPNATVADRLKNYLVDHHLVDQVKEITGITGPTVPGAQRGDLIGYDWNSDGIIDHFSVVTAEGSQYGPTLVTAHSNPRLNAPWDLGTLGTPNVRYYLLHVIY